jgi:hypothetical protein
MRGIVIAKMLVLTLWALYLAIGLTQGAGSDERRALRASRSCTLGSASAPTQRKIAHCCRTAASLSNPVLSLSKHA